MDSKYLKFDVVPRRKDAATKVIEVINVRHETLLGTIKWWGAWRQYVFVPEPRCVFNPECLNVIAHRVEGLTKEHRRLLRERNRG
jgi:hypothetical protein